MRYIRYTLRETAGGEKVVIPVPESYKDCFTLIQSDQFRKTGKIMPIWKIWLKTFINPTSCVFFWVRMREYRKGCLYRLACAINYYFKNYHNMLVDTSNIGYGLYYIVPYRGRLSKAAYLGNNINLSHNTNLGTNTGKALRTGDKVYIAPHVCTLSDNHIGSNTCVGTGSIVTKDLLSNSSYGGNPAKRIGDNKHPEFIGNPYPIPEIPEDKIEDIVI